MAKKKLKKFHKEDGAGIAIPAGLFIGMGIGFLTDNFVARMFIGLGAGFVFMLLATLLKKKR